MKKLIIIILFVFALACVSDEQEEKSPICFDIIEYAHQCRIGCAGQWDSFECCRDCERKYCYYDTEYECGLGYCR